MTMKFGAFHFFQAAPGLTHEEVIQRELEQMEWTEELGFDQILCWMNFGGLPQKKIRRSMELFAREVMPRFRNGA